MGKSLDELNCSEGPEALALHLAFFGWKITPPDPSEPGFSEVDATDEPPF